MLLLRPQRLKHLFLQACATNFPLGRTATLPDHVLHLFRKQSWLLPLPRAGGFCLLLRRNAELLMIKWWAPTLRQMPSALPLRHLHYLTLVFPNQMGQTNSQVLHALAGLRWTILIVYNRPCKDHCCLGDLARTYGSDPTSLQSTSPLKLDQKAKSKSLRSDGFAAPHNRVQS